MTRVGREIRMLEDYYLEGDAVIHQRVLRNGKPDSDLDVVASPRGAVLFALDLAYETDHEERVFKFGEPRSATFRFPLPAYIRQPAEVFRMDADGVTKVKHSLKRGVLPIQNQASRVAIYVVATSPGERARIEARQELIAIEKTSDFDPGRNPHDLAVLRKTLAAKRK